ncbi:hypothetical protein SAMN05421743_11447 [Thalassobacillus cyri]|uniref:Uncharacterized protein n=1 Tax=Thalassobacillus cyri TaxID=571932 RepID=A0A1H4G6B6_9BACI|nr:hypothetical protein [Thalassobacillus cyri]SEB05145.1 hypothetical protein SAMN05421743_11447 [Thalassobacillus cyri]
MKYLIDTITQVIHRSSYVGDVCDFHTTPLTQRESSQDENYVNRLYEETSYTKCKHGYQLAVAPSQMHL